MPTGPRRVPVKTVLETLSEKQREMLDRDVGSDHDDDEEVQDYYWSENELDSSVGE